MNTTLIKHPIHKLAHVQSGNAISAQRPSSYIITK
jgi:hypothetical protein